MARSFASFRWLLAYGSLRRPLSALAALLLLAALFVGGAQPFAAGLVAAPWDKLVHALVFGLLAVLFALALGGQRLAFGLAAGAALLLGAADELHQLALPGRLASWADFAADAVGVAVGLGLLWWCGGRSSH